MNAGTQVKTAFLGVAAVDIGGSTLCTLFDIPTGRRNREGCLELLNENAPRSEPGAGEKEKVESRGRSQGQREGAKEKVESRGRSQGQRGRISETVQKPTDR